MPSDFLSTIPFALTEKLVQISIISGILFYVVANPVIFKFVEKALTEAFGCLGFTIVLKDEKLLIFHSLVFAVLMGLSTKYLFSHLFKKLLSFDIRANDLSKPPELSLPGFVFSKTSSYFSISFISLNK